VCVCKPVNLFVTHLARCRERLNGLTSCFGWIGGQRSTVLDRSFDPLQREVGELGNFTYCLVYRQSCSDSFAVARCSHIRCDRRYITLALVCYELELDNVCTFIDTSTDLIGVTVDLRILVMLLLDTLPMLGNVLLLCFFVFFIFGIIGVQLWAGLLRNRCFLSLPLNVSAAGSVFSFLAQLVS